MLIPYRWSRRTVILLVMQTVDAAMHFRPKRKLFGGGVRLTDRTGPWPAEPDLHPRRRAGDALVRAAHGRRRPERAHRVDPQHPLDRPHPRRRRRSAPTPESGVVDAGNRVFGYENLLVCDGAAIPANPGVNPSLTITAKAEHAMSLIPPKEGAEPRHLPEAARPATPVAL